MRIVPVASKNMLLVCGWNISRTPPTFIEDVDSEVLS